MDVMIQQHKWNLESEIKKENKIVMRNEQIKKWMKTQNLKDSQFRCNV